MYLILAGPVSLAESRSRRNRIYILIERTSFLAQRSSLFSHSLHRSAPFAENSRKQIIYLYKFNEARNKLLPRCKVTIVDKAYTSSCLFCGYHSAMLSSPILFFPADRCFARGLPISCQLSAIT
jgi:hypothetical protein